MPFVEPPAHLLCPIGQQLMVDPGNKLLLIESFIMCFITVVIADGHTYERSAIEEWLFKKKNDTSPLTGLKLPNKILFPNQIVKGMVQSFFETNEVATKEQFLELVKSGATNKLSKLKYLERLFKRTI
jgi:hypothetical protein